MGAGNTSLIEEGTGPKTTTWRTTSLLEFEVGKEQNGRFAIELHDGNKISVKEENLEPWPGGDGENELERPLDHDSAPAAMNTAPREVRATEQGRAAESLSSVRPCTAAGPNVRHVAPVATAATQEDPAAGSRQFNHISKNMFKGN